LQRTLDPSERTPQRFGPTEVALLTPEGRIEKLVAGVEHRHTLDAPPHAAVRRVERRLGHQFQSLPRVARRGGVGDVVGRDRHRLLMGAEGGAGDAEQRGERHCQALRLTRVPPGIVCALGAARRSPYEGVVETTELNNACRYALPACIAP